MLTRLEVNGFKNLVDFSLDFGPYTCIAGPNGVGKSNIFDSIRFLSLLTNHTVNEAALQIRNAGEETGEIADLLFRTGSERVDRMEFAAEMIVGQQVWDDFGREAKASSSFLRYEVAFRYEPPSPTRGLLGGLELEREVLRPITAGNAARHLRFPHSKSRFRDSVVYNNRHARSGFVSTHVDPETEQPVIIVHQDGGSHGRGRPSPARGATRTIIGTENTSATPTILAARREMQSWRILALDPAAMRRPDRYTQPPGIAANGEHIPATLQHLTNVAAESGERPDVVLQMVSIILSELVPVNMVKVVKDDVRQLLSLQVEEQSGIKLRANSISDGTLRFLALAALTEVADESAVICMEEPENGIHPAKMEAMNRLLDDIAVDPHEPVDAENPMRQVIVATHSPYFVQLQNKEDLVLAKPFMAHSPSGSLVEHLLQCQPYHGAWRCSNEREGMNLLSLQSYLMPPKTAQIAFPSDFWEAIW